MEADYDGIILGTGHNALVLQAYLSRSGLRTLSLDRAPEPGGGLLTRENPRHPGCLHHAHSFFHRAITAMPWYGDLELERHGVRYLEPELNAILRLRNGRTLQWWTDLDRTAESFAQFSRKDARSLRRWVEEFRPLVENLLVPEAQSPPLSPDRRRQVLEQSREGRRLLQVSALSPLEFVSREFESDTVRAGLLFFNGLREVDLRLKGFGHAIPALLASRHKAQMCVGGSGRLAQGLVSDIEEHGGHIRGGVRVRRILMEKGKAAGVELDTGERIRAEGFLASGLNPQQTFLELLPQSEVAESLRRQAEQFQYNLLAPLFGLHLVLGEPPRYQTDIGESALMTILGLERFDQFSEIVRAHERGVIPGTVAWGSCPSQLDPSQASEGKHVAFLWEKLPYRLRGNPDRWLNEAESHGRELLSFWSRYAPNLGSGAVLDQFCLTPVDTEKSLPNMRAGDLLVGSFASGQVGYHRPFEGAGQYRTPVPGLYLCGGSTHPGGNITGLCGYNAAAVIQADFGKKIWWERPRFGEAI